MALAMVVLLVALAGCPGGGGMDAGSGGGLGGGGGGGGSTACAPAGVWQLDYSNFTGQPGCQPPREKLVVVPLDDGGFNASFGLHTFNACGDAEYYKPSNRIVSFDAGSCELSIDERSLSCWSGESQSNERMLVLHFAGDTVSGSGEGDACPTVSSGPRTLTATGQRLPGGAGGGGGGDGCAEPTFGPCNPIGTWKVTYTSAGPFAGCTPPDDTITLSLDGGALEATLPLDAGAACPSTVFFHPIHQDTHFDEARCELTLTTGVTWCDGPNGTDLHQDQRSLMITFNGDAGVGSGITLANSCNRQEEAVCVRVDRL